MLTTMLCLELARTFKKMLFIQINTPSQNQNVMWRNIDFDKVFWWEGFRSRLNSLVSFTERTKLKTWLLHSKKQVFQHHFIWRWCSKGFDSIPMQNLIKVLKLEAVTQQNIHPLARSIHVTTESLVATNCRNSGAMPRFKRDVELFSTSSWTGLPSVSWPHKKTITYWWCLLTSFQIKICWSLLK